MSEFFGVEVSDTECDADTKSHVFLHGLSNGCECGKVTATPTTDADIDSLAGRSKAAYQFDLPREGYTKITSSCQPDKGFHVFTDGLLRSCQCGMKDHGTFPENDETIKLQPLPPEPPLSDAPQATAGREQYKYDQVIAHQALEAIQAGRFDPWIGRLRSAVRARMESAEYNEWLMNLIIGQQESGK